MISMTVGAVFICEEYSRHTFMAHLFAHRHAAEHHDFAEQKRGVLREIDVDAPDDPRAVEQDGLLRQPAEMRAGIDLERNVEPRRDRKSVV